MPREASREVTRVVESNFRHDFFDAQEGRLNQRASLIHPKLLKVPGRRHPGLGAKQQRKTRRRKVHRARELGYANGLMKAAGHLFDSPCDAWVDRSHCTDTTLKGLARMC